MSAHNKAVVNGQLMSVSASQIRNWQQCNRKWWFEKVGGFKPEPTPQQQVGELIHNNLERHLKYGEPLQHESSQRAIELVNARRRALLLAEYPKNYKLNLLADTVPVKGRIDLLDLNPLKKGVIRILDFKTSNNFDYNKTPEELAHDIQLVMYAKWAFQRFARFDVKYAQVSHIYIHKKQTAAKLIETDGLDEAHVDGIYKQVESLVSKMRVTAGLKNHSDVPKTESACYAYGKPCPFLEYCNSDKTTDELKTDLETRHMDFIEKLKARTESAETPAVPVEETTTGDLYLYVDCYDTSVKDNLRLEDEIARRTPDVLKQVAAKERRPEFEKALDVREIPYGAGTSTLLADFKRNPPTGHVVASMVGLSAQIVEVLAPLAKRVIRSTK